jgi:hypothetical protein
VTLPVEALLELEDDEDALLLGLVEPPLEQAARTRAVAAMTATDSPRPRRPDGVEASAWVLTLMDDSLCHRCCEIRGASTRVKA